MRASLLLALLARGGAAARRGLGARAGLRRRAADARQGRMAARSGLDGTSGPRERRRRADAAHDAQRGHHRGPADLGLASDHAELGHLHAEGTHHGDDVLEPGPRGDRGLALPAARGRSRAHASSPRSLSARRRPCSNTAPTACWRHRRFTCRRRAATRRGRTISGSVAAFSASASAKATRWATASSTAPSMAIGRHSCGLTIRSLTCVSLSRPWASTPRGDNITASRWSRAAAIRFWLALRRLLLYKQYGLEAGLLFPVYQQTNFQPEEKLRFGVNFTYFFWRK